MLRKKDVEGLSYGFEVVVFFFLLFDKSVKHFAVWINCCRFAER